MSTPQPLTGRSRTVAIWLNRRVYWFNRHWLAVFTGFFTLYTGLAVLAPILMKLGLTAPARLLYWIYGFFCHGMASRSFFLFGEQIAYPSALAGTTLRPMESYLSSIPSLAALDPAHWLQYQTALRSFIGNEQLGYKIALCERDLAIYTAVVLAGVALAVARRYVTIRPFSILVFVVVGLAPIAWDGFSQLFGYAGTPFPGQAPTALQAAIASIFPLRESTPLLRVATGSWFGLFFGWLIFSYLEDDMRPLRLRLEEKLARIDAAENGENPPAS